MKQLVIFILILLSSNVNAQWFQAKASATIVNGNVEKARNNAIRKAVKDTLLYSGQPLSNLQQLYQLKINDKRLNLNSEGEIKGLQIINEIEKDDILTIDIKVDIVPQKMQCMGRKYPKSIIVTRFSMNVPEQTVHGQVYNLHKKVGEVLFNELSLSPSLFNVRNYVDTPLKLGKKYNNKNLPDTLRSLSIQNDSQFVIYGEINDLSIDFKHTGSERNFYTTIYLYDAFQGQLLLTKQYRAKALWEYGREEKVNLNSKKFWDKQYGEAIISSLDQANADIYQKLQCIIPRARIIDVNSNIVQINLGKKNGLAKEDKFDLSYSSNFKDQFGIERNSSTISKQKMQVTEIHENSAVLSTIDNYPLSNIQINDIAHIKPTK